MHACTESAELGLYTRPVYNLSREDSSHPLILVCEHASRYIPEALNNLGLDDAAARFLQTAAARLAWSARGTHRALKVARTIADLAGSEHITVAHVAEAMQYRRVLRAASGA